MCFPCACAFSFTSFSFVKNFDFIWKISFYLAKSCVLALRKNTWKSHLKKNSIIYVFSLRLCVFIHIFHLCYKLWFYFKNIILFSKILRSCAAQKHMIIKLEQKLTNVSVFLAPVRFQSYISALLKTLISFEKYHFI